MILTPYAAGEMSGYLFGCGDAMPTLSNIEFYRHRFMDRYDLYSPGAEQTAGESAPIA
jgi:hypothetical protein